MNVVAYIRVSTDGQVGEDKYGLEVQRQQIEDYCNKNGHTILKWYRDEGESGAKLRKTVEVMLSAETNPPVEAVIIAKNDRLARDIEVYFYYKMRFRLRGMQLISVAEDFGPHDPYSKVYEAISAAFADLERDLIRDRTSAGRAVKAAAGGYSGGRVPIGYKLVDGAWVVVPDQAELVRRIFTMRSSGMTLTTISDTLNSEGITTGRGGKFYDSSVRGILVNEPLYRGLYRYGKDSEWVQGQHEAILKD